MLFTTATRGSKNAIEPSLSSTSLTNTSPSPTLALAKGEPAAMKFFISAPFMIVGLFPARCRIQPIMPTVVDLPLVPATPTPKAARVEEFGEKPRAGGDGGTDTTRGLHVGDRLLDSGGGDQDLIGCG